MTSTAASSAMIGREADFAELNGALRASIAGRPRIVIVGGEAGIGKTRLLDEFSALAAAEALVVSGQCVDLGTVGSPYAPVKSIIRSIIAALGTERVQAAGGPGSDALAALVPELGPVVRAEAAGTDRLHETVAILLETLSQEHPLVVVIEDLHWADDGTLNLIRFLLRVLSQGRLTVVLSFRSDDVSRGHPLRGLLSELERNRNVSRLTLQRLNRTQVRQQIRSIIGTVPEGEGLDSLFTRSEGVPFFVEELIGFDESCEGDLPETLRELLLARYERLSPDTQHFLRLISAGGVRVEHELLERVFRGDADELDAAAREAVLASVLVADERSYSFRHALVREAIHADLLPGERTRFHTRYAEALEASSGDRPVATEISYHRLAAHDLAKAFATSFDAMREARASYAYGTAAQMGERALELWDQITEPEQVAGRTKIDLIAQTASALRNAGEGERSLAMVNQALRECPRDEAYRYARLLRDKALYLGNIGKPGSIPLLQEALILVPEGSEGLAGSSGLGGTTITTAELRSALLTALAGRLMIEARLPEAVETASQAFQEAKSAGSERHMSIASNILGVSRVNSGEFDRGLGDLRRARELAHSDGSAMLRYRVNASDIEYLLGNHADALQIAELGMARARELGVERSSGVILASNAVDPLIALGRWSTADQLIERSIALSPSPAFNAYLNRAQIWLSLWRGDVDDAWQHYRSQRASMAALGEVEVQVKLGIARVAVEVAVTKGDLAEAWALSRPLFEEDHRPLPGYEWPLLAAVARAVAAIRRDDANGAGAGIGDPVASDGELAGAERGIRRLGDAVSYWPTEKLWSAFVDAELSGVGGTGCGVAEWRVAVALSTESVAPAHLHPYALVRLGQALLEEGERAEAAEQLRAGRAAAETLGAHYVSGLADAIADRGGLGAGDAVRSRGVALSTELTAREEQVLRLIAQGLTNRQIGEQLFISAKTASVHVSAILRKLGATSRTEAAFIARQPSGQGAR